MSDRLTVILPPILSDEERKQRALKNCLGSLTKGGGSGFGPEGCRWGDGFSCGDGYCSWVTGDGHGDGYAHGYMYGDSGGDGKSKTDA
jgi:hypothetical protein